MIQKPNVVEKIYDLRQKFAVIGLTGRTGSGCTTVADLLTKADFQGLEAPVPTVNPKGVSNDERKYKILYTYLSNVWKEDKIRFVKIKASDIIFFFVLLDGFNKFIEAFKGTQSEKDGVDHPEYEALKLTLESNFKESFPKIAAKAEDIKKLLQSESIQHEDLIKINDFIFSELPLFINKISAAIKSSSKKKLYKQFQEWGNNIRRYGVSYKSTDETAVSPALLAETINKIIKIKRALHEGMGLFFIVDSLRNPYEVLYFRERYSAFYLMSINTDESNRKHNLEEANYAKDDINTLDGVEHPEKRKGIADSYYTQDVQSCIEISDIHIVHHNEPVHLNYDLKKQLVHFVALMLHPGLVSPSPIERLMQVAYTAKLNSGCVSRQVGAAVTDCYFSVKAIGWNTVPEGQTPCSLRDFNDLCNNCDLSAFSLYELEDIEFRNVIHQFRSNYSKASASELKTNYGLPLPFCFKDFYTVQKKGQKNQVHTRSLHAEENAFLQLAKYGSEGIRGGKLFTTASCCELCAKKAYQLGIKEIYYIDTYPGISLRHILMSGSHTPELKLFQGAIGRAYLQLYTPLLALKDEIEFLTTVKVEFEAEQEKEKPAAQDEKIELKENRIMAAAEASVTPNRN